MNAELLKLARQKSAICSVFGNPSRILILWTLAERECSVSEIASAIDASPQNTSQHLRFMELRSIVESRREGNIIYYHLVGKSLDGCGLLPIAESTVPVGN